jgi:uncharacterized protein DUF4386
MSASTVHPGGTMTEQITHASPRLLARVAGAFDLLEALTSGFGQIIVPIVLVVFGDAATTAANILAHEQLFRLALLAGLVGVASHIVWTFLFYQLFKPVSRSLSLLAAFVSLVAIATQAFSSVFQLAPLVILQGGASLGAFDVQQGQALALLFLQLFAQAFYVYLALFGLWCVLIGYLIFRSTFLPRVLGVLEALAGVCWLTFLWPPLARSLSPYNQAVAGVAEIALMLWLIVMGVNAQRWTEQASSAGNRR